jgi:ribosomal-protein-alanine N-acetyltransferase
MNKERLKQMNNFIVKPFTEEYIDRVTQIDKLSFTIPWSRESFLRELENNNNANYIVLFKDDILIAYAGIWLILDEGHITNVAVHPNYRMQGAGTCLMNSLIEICHNNNITSMTLEVRKSNVEALKLYKKYNFAQEGLRKFYYADNNEDAIIMWKYNI